MRAATTTNPPPPPSHVKSETEKRKSSAFQPNRLNRHSIKRIALSDSRVFIALSASNTKDFDEHRVCGLSPGHASSRFMLFGSRRLYMQTHKTHNSLPIHVSEIPKPNLDNQYRRFFPPISTAQQAEGCICELIYVSGRTT